MWKRLTAVILMLAYGQAYDHDLYHNCSRVEICSQNRELERLNRFKPVLERSMFAKGLAAFTLLSIETSDEELYLNITAIKGNIFRVQIEEKTSPRHHLQYVLDGEPELVNFDDVILSVTSATLIVGSNRAVINTNPFSIDFYSGPAHQLVLRGDRLTLKTAELHDPFTAELEFPSASRLYGLHEHADTLALHGTSPNASDPYRVKTLDLTYYELFSTMGMYGAVPVVYGHGPDSTAGIFIHNAAEQWVDIDYSETVGARAYFMVDSGALDIFAMLGPSIEDVVRQYTSLTGVAHLPQIWTLGYHQCRWGYADQEDVQTVIAELDANDFPVDVIWLDIQHTNDKKFFTWNPGNFSDPLDMLKNLSATHRYLVTLSDPHFKKEEGYFVYDEGIAKDYFIKNPNGTFFEDECWPGTSVWMDYLNPDARDYYSSLYSYKNWEATPTLGGIWNDMNEAAIFDEPNEKTFPYDVVHYGGVSNRDVHNMYGFLQTMATHKGLMDRDNGTLRPFILTRAHFAGSQRYAAFWTGDNSAEWGYIPISYAMCLSSNLLGLPFCGADVGGFFGEPSEELLQRFYQAGAWLPFFREHSNIGSERREPYLYGEDVQDVIRNAIKTRYEHLPVWYTLFYEHTRTGAPVIRPLFYHYPEDTNVYDIDDQLLVGSNILVKAIGESQVKSVKVYFPGGKKVFWTTINLDNVTYPGTGWTEINVAIDKIPVFYRQGGVIPTKIAESSTTLMKNSAYILTAILDENKTAAGNVYIDDTLSFDYINLKKYSYLNITLTGLGFTNLIISPVENSDSEDFEFLMDELQVLEPKFAKDGSQTGRFVKSRYTHAADGTPLANIKINKKKPTTIRL